jgi:hypothetical protein
MHAMPSCLLKLGREIMTDGARLVENPILIINSAFNGLSNSNADDFPEPKLRIRKLFVGMVAQASLPNFKLSYDGREDEDGRSPFCREDDDDGGSGQSSQSSYDGRREDEDGRSRDFREDDDDGRARDGGSFPSLVQKLRMMCAIAFLGLIDHFD